VVVIEAKECGNVLVEEAAEVEAAEAERRGAEVQAPEAERRGAEVEVLGDVAGLEQEIAVAAVLVLSRRFR
jgi:hypothetical protein